MRPLFYFYDVTKNSSLYFTYFPRFFFLRYVFICSGVSDVAFFFPFFVLVFGSGLLFAFLSSLSLLLGVVITAKETFSWGEQTWKKRFFL